MIVYDCEIENAIPNKSGNQKSGIKYCKGWGDYIGMGISCIGVYNYKNDQFSVFCKDNIDQFQRLIDSSRFVIGFNNHYFDDKLCEAHKVLIPKSKSYDLYIEVKKAAGLSESARVKGYNLDSCARANLKNIKKTEDGSMAPAMWQRGEIGRVITYCLSDVAITRDLLEIAYSGKFKDPVSGRSISVRIPS